MKTTIELPDDLVRKAREQAERQGLDVERFISKAVISALAAESSTPSHDPGSGRVALPLIKSKGRGPLSIADDVRGALETQEDFAKHASSLRR
jgi:hypothetical protein